MMGNKLGNKLGKGIAAVLCVGILIAGFCGCGAKEPAADPSVPGASGQTENVQEGNSSFAQEDPSSPVKADKPSLVQEGNSSPIQNPERRSDPSADQASITADEAEAIALRAAGLTADDVIMERTELDQKDNEYEVEFRKGMTEYEYEIRVTDGAVVNYDIDQD